MKTSTDIDRPLAVITGGSSGLGEQYAKQLAAQGYDLLLIARGLSRLEKTRQEILDAYPVAVETDAVDLADPEQLRRLEERIAKFERLEILVNNAGFGQEGGFPVADIDQECKMLAVHTIAPLRLTQAALGPMIRRGKGYIINVTSVAAFLYGPECAQYMATKAYLLSFSKCLQCDVRKYGIRVQALCPGLVRTGFHSTEIIDQEKYQKIPNFLWLKSDRVVRDSLKNLFKKWHSVVYITSRRSKFFTVLLTFPFLGLLAELPYRLRAAAATPAPPPLDKQEQAEDRENQEHAPRESN